VVAALATAASPERRGELVAEGSDLLFHLLVLLAATGVGPEELGAELARRHFGERSPAAPAGPATLATQPAPATLATPAAPAAPAAAAPPAPGRGGA
jgi:hypothetical protein